MQKTRACEDVEVSINIMRLRNICPRWTKHDYPLTDCWCHSSRQADKSTIKCPTKPDGWKEGMFGSVS